MSGDCESIDSKLCGESLGERHRSLNQLIKEASPDALSAEAVRDWAHSSHGQQIYIARLVDHFKNAALLCELLCSENEMVVSVALHSTWFFQGLTDKEFCNAHYFITQIFPRASYHSICRIISALSVNLQDEAVAEDFYTQISAMYGNHLAIRLLPVCSIDFIRAQIMEDNFEVPQVQLSYIYKKNQKLVLDFLTKSLKKEGSDKMPKDYNPKKNYSKIWYLIAQDHLDMFLEFFDKYPKYVNIKLGSQTTRYTMKIALDKIINDPSKYMDILHVQTLIRKMKLPDLEMLLFNLLPAKEKDFYYCDISSALQYLKPTFQLSILSKVYTKKYDGSLIWEKDQFTDWDLTQYLPLEVRIPWALETIKNLKSTDYRNEYFFLKYLPTEKAIPRLQALIFTSPDLDKRRDILKAMIECCKINDDLDALLEVLKYIATRHRNEQVRLRFGLLNFLESTFKIHLLSAEHWEVINEMLDFMILSGDIEKHYQYNLCQDILKEYVHYCLLNNLEIDSVINKMLENNVSSIVFLGEKPEYQDKIIDIFFSKYRKMIEENPKGENVENYVYTLLNSYRDRVNKKISIMDCTWLVNIIRSEFTMNPNRQGKFVNTYVGDIKARNAFSTEILEYYDCDKKLISNYFKHDANIFIKNISILVNRIVADRPIKRLARLLQQIKAYFMNPLGKELQSSLHKIIESDDVKQGSRGIIVLCLLANVEESEKLLKQYVPRDTKVDIQMHVRTYKIAEAIGSNMKLINPPVSFDILKSFLDGDYLKFSLKSLLSMCFKKSMKSSENLILELSKKAISVRKHSVRLAYFLYPRKDLLQLYRDMWSAVRNSSIRDVLFQRTFRMLETERDVKKRDEIWSVIKSFMESFEAIDKNLFCYLSTPGRIYPELVPDYCQTSWKILKLLSKQKIDVDIHIINLTDNLTEFMEFLDEELSESIITDCLMSIGEGSDNSDSLLTFLINYIVKAKDIEMQKRHFESTKDIMIKFIKEKWNEKKENSFTYRTSVEKFVNQFCSISLSAKMRVNPVLLLKNIIEMLSSSLPFGAIFKLHVLLNLTIILIELSQKPHPADLQSACQFMKEFGLKVAAYLNLLCVQYGIHIQPIFYKSFVYFKSNLPSPDKMNDVLSGLFELNTEFENQKVTELSFICGLLEGEATEQCVLMAIDLLPRSFAPDCKHRAMYMEVLNTIQAKSSPTLLMNLDCKIPMESIIFE